MRTELSTNHGWIRTRGLCRFYQRAEHVVRAVDQVDFAIEKGEFVAVVGASGSGKSTLLNLLAGLDTPTAGHVEVAAQRLDRLSRRDLSAYRRRVGMVFQSFNLLYQHTALRNVEIALYFDDTPRRERRDRAAAALERIGLGQRLHHRPVDLSGGEQQRVAMARALVKRPEILFADEPTGNLDHDNAAEIAGLLTELNRGGMTVVLVTHDLAMARRIAARTVRMHYGSMHLDDMPVRP